MPTSDLDNNPLAFSWTANAGAFTGSGSTIQWTAPTNAGNYVVQCSVSDGKGGSASETTDIIVTIPVPEISIRVIPQSTTMTAGELLTVGALVSGTLYLPEIAVTPGMQQPIAEGYVPQAGMFRPIPNGKPL